MKPLAKLDENKKLGTVTYTQSKLFVWNTLGGLMALFLIKAYLFRLNNPDIFYEILTGVLGAIGIVILLFPPKLILSPSRIRVASFGRTWVDVPWDAIAEIELFRTPRVRAFYRAVGGARVIGVRVRPEYRGLIKPRSGPYGYDAAFGSGLDVPVEVIANQCGLYWRAHGGKGEVINLIGAYDLDKPDWNSGAQT